MRWSFTSRPIKYYKILFFLLDGLSELTGSLFRPLLYLAILLADLFFLGVNLTCTLLMKMTETDPKSTALVRVAVNDTLFVLCALSLSLCLCKITKMSLANTYLESKVSPKYRLNYVFAKCKYLHRSQFQWSVFSPVELYSCRAELNTISLNGCENELFQ